ncbi:permease-like cell division protein FtsX [Nonomuraea pusilla]|uniref:permease-like cell division protein FtsX n=1 Tax=Nonomuraea pusilla TaxID=46177 RepID=UPI0033311F02
MKHWLCRATVAAVVALAATAGPAASAAAEPPPEIGAGDDWEIAVFLCTPSAYDCHKRYATAGQRRDVERFLKATPEVTQVRYVSRATAYAGFRKEFAGREAVLAGVRARDLPESFRVRVSGVADRGRIRALANRRPGVGIAVDQAESHAGATAISEWWDMSLFLCIEDSAMPVCLRGRGRANKKAVTDKEKKAIAAAIAGIPEVESYEYEDQATAYRNFVEANPDKQELISGTKVSDMPESFRLTLRPEADWAAPRRRLARMPGVSDLSDKKCNLLTLRLWSEYGLRGLPPGMEGCP